MKTEVNSEKAVSNGSDKAVKLEILQQRITRKLDQMIEAYNQAESKKQRLTIINQLDDIVSSEIYYWTNILADIPEDCSPCQETKGEEAKDQITILASVLQGISELRQQVIEEL